MNKITCICLGVRNMSLAIRFYRDGLGFETCEKGDEPQVIFFNTPGTKFELYPLGLLAKDISETNPPKIAEGFAGITLAYNVERREEVDVVIEKYAKQEAESRKNPRKLSGAVIMPTSPILTGIIGRWCGAYVRIR